jgi:aryl-alcohol dehydrogenase
MHITAAVMEKADSTLRSRKIALEEVELEAPRADEVLVRITHAGVCWTDRGCIHGLEPYPTPGVLGHEGAGVVEALGSDVRAFKVGDRVMIGFPHCGRCAACRRGEPHYCDHAQTLLFSGHRLHGSGGVTRRGGEPLAARFQQSSWATHTLALERQLARVPEGLDLSLAAPLGCSISTGAGTVFHELAPTPGSSLAIFGVGQRRTRSADGRAPNTGNHVDRDRHRSGAPRARAPARRHSHVDTAVQPLTAAASRKNSSNRRLTSACG